MADEEKPSTYKIPCSDTVQCVEFCPFDWSCNLLAVGQTTGISVFSCRFQEEDAEIAHGIEYSLLKDFPTKACTLAIAWSPETSLQVQPKVMCLAAAFDDQSLKIFSTDMISSHSVKVLSGHTSFVNALTFDPSEGLYLASTGDDFTCRVWSVEKCQEEQLLQLTAPGMAVCWHADEPHKLMVAQKDGTIRLFSLHNNRPFMSIKCGQSPLMSADWSRHNNLLIGAAAGSDWFVFNLSLSSLPIESRQAHSDGARLFRWSRCHESLLATCGRPNKQLKVFNTRHQQLHIDTKLKLSSGLSWHLLLPIVAVGGDKMVHLWSVESI